MEIVNSSFVFQTDSNMVKDAYKRDNCLIAYNTQNMDSNICAIYFSSNDIYFPNNEEAFQNQIVNKDFYEWFNNRIEKAYKHIFIRDIQKQWYLGGINSSIDSPEKLLAFLIDEVKDFSVITLGSSAGGYAAVLYGQLLNAKKILSFNGQFMLSDLLESSTEEINPLVFRFRDNPKLYKFYSLGESITNVESIFYFNSNRSSWDVEQLNHINGKKINVILFRTSHHGIPFLKVALGNVINASTDKLKEFTFKQHNPLLFTIHFVGLKATMLFLFKILSKKVFKR